ncbi:molybdate ABC transporter substrate-binding protein [Nitratiruptor tergarcus]|uniref:Molybdate transport system substrate-binding protein n=1 Tax=Nitratiruptor tergarcus DSM 16512 TaxID=1069081 RepID=A0A1W1WR96_9BACT|nr:molybdate ABC transporter substrate-binding protein [Nitratiruptor tergarcus]SMC08834.1 molybdate transport system substrate-binding protein [Nitratiruptor tergarcus DSM 16512]
MKKLLSFLFFAIMLYAGKIHVAVAANVSFVMPELLKAFKNVSPQTDVKVSIGSSGKLAAQIKKGAPFALFLSADMYYPKTLYKEGYAITRPLVYAKGALVIFSKRYKSIADIAKASRIAIANPKTAPYGRAALEVLQHLGLYEKLKDKLIYGDSVAQTTSYALRVADAGFIAKSAIHTKTLQNLQDRFITVDPKLYSPIKQGVVMLKRDDDANAFFTFLFSKEAAQIFQKYGYIVDD